MDKRGSVELGIAGETMIVIWYRTTKDRSADLFTKLLRGAVVVFTDDELEKLQEGRTRCGFDNSWKWSKL